jgi:urea transport system substrate-binding protein
MKRLAGKMASIAAACVAAMLAMTAAGLAADPIKIGAVLPFSGGVELYGEQGRLGLEVAAAEINAAGGILGRPVQLVFRDDGTRANIAAEAARRIVEEDNVLAVIGPITSQGLDAVVPVLASRKTPLLYATNYEGGTCNRYMFALNTVPNQELTSLLPYLTRTFGSDYYLLGADRDWPHRMFDAAEPLIAQLGARVVAKEYTRGTEKDFSPLIGRLVDSKAKILLFALKGDGMQLITDASERGVFKSMTVGFLGFSEADLKFFGGKVDGVHAAVPFVAASPDPKARAFVARARAMAAPGVAVSNYVERHYAALFAVKAALEKAGKVDKEAMIDALEGLTFDTPAGPTTVGKDHHSTLNMYLARTEGTELVPVQALGPVAPVSGCTVGALPR